MKGGIMYFRIKLIKNRVDTLRKLQGKARKEGSLVLYRRTTALLLLNTGLTQEFVAKTLGVVTRAVQKWTALYFSKGARALSPRKSPGRPSYLSREQKKQLSERIESGPQKCGYAGSVWTSAMIQELIQKQFKVFYSLKYISQLLQQLGLRHIKPKFCYSLTKEQLKKQVLWIREEFPELYKKVKENNGVLLFQDESTFQLQSNLHSTWAAKGNPPTYERNPKRENVKVLGVIEFGAGKCFFSVKEKKLDSKVFAQYLKQVAKHYQGQEVYIVLDGATYHGGQYVRAFQEKNPNIHLVRQPVKSPNLNPIEKLWKEVKRNFTHNCYFKNKSSLKKAIRRGLRFFQSCPEKIKSLMAKWERVVADPKGARAGCHDSSLIPDKYHKMLDDVRKDVWSSLRNLNKISAI